MQFALNLLKLLKICYGPSKFGFLSFYLFLNPFTFTPRILKTKAKEIATNTWNDCLLPKLKIYSLTSTKISAGKSIALINLEVRKSNFKFIKLQAENDQLCTSINNNMVIQ